jgi:hypothetical protein
LNSSNVFKKMCGTVVWWRPLKELRKYRTFKKRVTEMSGVQKGLRKYRVFKKESTSLFITCLFYFLYLLFSYWDMFRASCWRKLVKIERNSFMFRYFCIWKIWVWKHLRNFTLSNASQMWLHNFKDKMQNTLSGTENHS